MLSLAPLRAVVQAQDRAQRQAGSLRLLRVLGSVLRSGLRAVEEAWKSLASRALRAVAC